MEILCRIVACVRITGMVTTWSVPVPGVQQRSSHVVYKGINFVSQEVTSRRPYNYLGLVTLSVCGPQSGQWVILAVQAMALPWKERYLLIYPSP
jgi:hypothetical protein